MSDPLPSPPPPPAGKSPNKRKTTAVASSPATKRPKNFPLSTPTTTTDIEDTATSKPKDIVKEVDLDDIEVLESIIAYRSKKGVSPFENPTAMKNFVLPWVILGIGNENVWKTKLERVKTKFTKASDPVEDGERKEFELWMKIFGDDDRDPGGGL